jgi:hypothetical protein
MWTSPKKKGSQAIVALWADAETRRVECALLSLKAIKGAHGGEEQAAVFLKVAEEDGLKDKVGFFTMDNHTSNDKMLRHISKGVHNFDAIFRRVRCFRHILNFAVQAFLFAIGSKKSGEDRRHEEEAIDLAIREVAILSKDQDLETQDKRELAERWRKLGSLGKLHNINVWTHTSSQRYDDFVEAVGRGIPLDNGTLRSM